MRIVSYYNQYGSEYRQVQYRNHVGVWSNVYSLSADGVIDSDFYIAWNYYTDNVVQYSVYSSAGSFLAVANSTARISGADYVNKSQFLCNNLSIYPSYGADASDYTVSRAIRFYGYIDETLTPPDFGDDMSDYLYRCVPGAGITRAINPYRYVEQTFDFKYTGKVYGVDLIVHSNQYDYVSSTVGHYSLYVNGNSMGTPSWVYRNSESYYLRFTNSVGISLSDVVPVFSYGCSAWITDTEAKSLGLTNQDSPTGRYYWVGLSGVSPSDFVKSKVHDQITLHVNEFFDGSTATYPIAMCYYFLQNESLEYDENFGIVDSAVMDDYKDLYGDSNKGYAFIEFENHHQICYYGVGDSPTIVFWLNDTYMDGSPCYGYQIRYVPTDSLVYVGFLCFDGHLNGSFYVSDFSFPKIGAYQILLYNLTTGSTVNELYVSSKTLTVCEYGSGSMYDPGAGIVDPEDDDAYDFSADEYGMLIGFALALSIGFVAMYAGGGGLGFLSGFFGSLMLFSVPDTIIYMGFPIWVLFLCGLSLIAFIFTTVRR